MATKMRVVPPIFEGANDPEPFAEAPAPIPLVRDQRPGQPLPAHTAEEASPGVRYARGSLVYAIDGPVGTLRQVVIDEEMAEVKALVVRMATKKESVLVPPDLVERSVDAALLLNVTREQFLLGASRSPRMESKMFTGASAKRVAKVVPALFGGDWRRSVVSLAGDHVVTGESLAPATAGHPAPSRSPWWKRLRRR